MPETTRREPKPMLLVTDKWRWKAGRLQRGYTHRPWVEGSLDPTYLRWIDVPVVADDSPDEELFT